ncbi:hypothetical protein JYU34_022366, partial [Plutella xylostella]
LRHILVAHEGNYKIHAKFNKITATTLLRKTCSRSTKGKKDLKEHAVELDSWTMMCRLSEQWCSKSVTPRIANQQKISARLPF